MKRLICCQILALVITDILNPARNAMGEAGMFMNSRFFAFLMKVYG